MEFLADYIGAIVWNWWSTLFPVLAFISQAPRMIRVGGHPEIAAKIIKVLRHRCIKISLVVLAILVFIGLNFNAYVDARRNILKLEKTITLLKTPTEMKCRAGIEWIAKTVKPNPSKKGFIITRTARITGQPYNVTFEVDGDGVTILWAKSKDERRFDILAGPDQLQPSGIRLTIQEPRGLYDVIIWAKDLDKVILTETVRCEP